MVYQWQPETQYNLGDIVEYEAIQYKIVQPHQSQADWTPPATPALWSRLPQGYGGQQQPQQPQQPVGGPPSYDAPSGPPSQEGEGKSWDQHSTQKVDIPHEDRKKNWWDLDEHKKKDLEVGGGLAAGLALLGAGYYAYEHHKKSDEEKKAQVWALQNWLHDAQARTEDYHQNGLRAPVAWILTHGQNIPESAIQGGEEHGKPLYIARAFQDGGLMIGKASPSLKKGAAIGYKHEEIDLDTYEILVGDSRGTRWIEASGHFNADSFGYNPVEGGRESNGSAIYIAQAPYHGGVHPGKASAALDGAYIPYDGKEKQIKEYRVLCLA